MNNNIVVLVNNIIVVLVNNIVVLVNNIVVLALFMLGVQSLIGGHIYKGHDTPGGASQRQPLQDA